MDSSKQDNSINTGIVYDEATLNSFEETMDDMLSGKEKTYTLKEVIERINEHRRANRDLFS